MTTIKQFKTILFTLAFLLTTHVWAQEDGCAFGDPEPDIPAKEAKKLKSYKTVRSGSEKSGDRKLVETFTLEKKYKVSIVQEVGCEHSVGKHISLVVPKPLGKPPYNKSQWLKDVKPVFLQVKQLMYGPKTKTVDEIDKVQSNLKDQSNKKDKKGEFTLTHSDEYTSTKVQFKQQDAKSTLVTIESTFSM